MRHTHTDLAKTVIRVILFEPCSSTLLDSTVLCAMELLVMSVIVKERQNILFSSSWKDGKGNYHPGSQLK